MKRARWLTIAGLLLATDMLNACSDDEEGGPGKDASADGAGRGGATGDSGSDARRDVTEDTSLSSDADAGVDSGRDSAPDVSSDVQLDSPADVSGDRGADVHADAPDRDSRADAADAATPNEPFELDCGNLPANGACDGGPREVLLNTTPRGTAVFDANDGRFIGYWQALLDAQAHRYSSPTQGPDQCIWAKWFQGDHLSGTGRIGRWDTDGARLGTVLTSTLEVGSEQEQFTLTSFALSRDHLFALVSFGIARFTLQGQHVETLGAWPVNAMLAYPDNTVIGTHPGLYRFQAGKASQSLGEFETVFGPIAAIRPSGILTAGRDGLLYRISAVSGDVLARARAIAGDDTGAMPDIYGVAPLRNGKWIFSSKLGVGIVDPAVGPSAPPVSTFWNDASYPGNLGSFGRACVPTAFVDALSRDAG